MKASAVRHRYRKGIYFLNLVLFIVPLTYFGYRPALRYCASLLIVDEPLKKSDAIVVLAGGEPGRPWGAADLYNRDLADYVIVTRDQVQPEEAELVQRGIDLVDGRGNYIRVLRGLGVPNEKIVSVEKAAGDTVSEMQQIRKLCLERNWHSLIIVTANYHTRRARMAARYVLGPEFKFAVSATPHGGLNSREWWTSRSDIRTFLIEFEKLVAYTLYIGPKILARDVWTSRSDTNPSSSLLGSPNSYSMWPFSSFSWLRVGASEYVVLLKCCRGRTG